MQGAITILWVFIGGGIGSAARYLLSGAVLRQTTGVFPAGTMAVNLAGCFVIGCLWALAERGAITTTMRNFLFIGILGGFTTFSSFGLETMNLIRAGEWGSAAVNVLVSNFVGIFLVIAGFILVRALVR